MTCLKALLAAALVMPGPASNAAHDEDSCMQVTYITCTVAELCFEGYSGDQCFQQAQLRGQCLVENHEHES